MARQGSTIDWASITAAIDDVGSELIDELKGLRRDIQQQTRTLRLLIGKVDGLSAPRDCCNGQGPD